MAAHGYSVLTQQTEKNTLPNVVMAVLLCLREKHAQITRRSLAHHNVRHVLWSAVRRGSTHPTRFVTRGRMMVQKILTCPGV